jgi:hypothetical protein
VVVVARLVVVVAGGTVVVVAGGTVVVVVVVGRTVVVVVVVGRTVVFVVLRRGRFAARSTDCIPPCAEVRLTDLTAPSPAAGPVVGTSRATTPPTDTTVATIAAPTTRRER